MQSESVKKVCAGLPGKYVHEQPPTNIKTITCRTIIFIRRQISNVEVEDRDNHTIYRL